jgi:uncharacterized protein (DUF2249 family)
MEIVFDARSLEHPEPLERVLALLSEVDAGNSILMIHRREPFPLYGILEKRGYKWNTKEIAENHFEIRIAPEGM